MATYYGTYGQKVQYLSSDPSDPQVGQVWYNSTSAVLKVRGFSTASWATGGNMTNVQRANAGSGIQTAALTFGGVNPTTGSSGSSITQKYDGSTWTNTGSLNTARYAMNGAGTQTATYGNGGYAAALPAGYTGKTETFNGTSWSNGTDSPRYVSSGTGCGTQTAALVGGGYDNTNWNLSSLLYTGGTWTTGPSYASPTTLGAQGSGSAGTQTSAIIFGGYIPPAATGNGSQTYNGTSFSNAPSLNNTAYRSGAGTQTSAIAFASQDPLGASNWTELYNGTSWTTTTGFSTPRGDTQQNSANSAPNTAGLIFGGNNSSGTIIDSTEEFTGAQATTKTVTVS